MVQLLIPLYIKVLFSYLHWLSWMKCLQRNTFQEKKPIMCTLIKRNSRKVCNSKIVNFKQNQTQVSWQEV